MANGWGGPRANSGGPRTPAGGRPKGSKTKTYRPHIEKALAAEAGGLTPKDTLLAVMRWHFKAKRYDDAARVAALVCPYIHPRLSCSNVTVKPSLREVFAQASDEELRAMIAEVEEDLGITEDAGDFATVKAKGNA